MSTAPLRLFRISAVLACLAATRFAAAEESTYHETVPVPPHARWLTVPAELGHSAAWSKRRPGPLYEFDAALLPGVLFFDRLGVHLSAELHYRNPGWDGGPGARVDYLLTPVFGGFVPIRVLAGTSYLAHDNAWRAECGFGAGLGQLLTLSVQGGYETDREVGFVHLALGFDLAQLSDPVAGITHYVPQETP